MRGEKILKTVKAFMIHLVMQSLILGQSFVFAQQQNFQQQNFQQQNLHGNQQTQFSRNGNSINSNGMANGGAANPNMVLPPNPNMMGGGMMGASPYMSPAGQVLNAVGNVGRQFMNAAQMGAAMNQSIAEMALYRPKFIPSKYFPDCAVGQDSPPFPINACEQELNPHDQASAQKTQMYLAAASKYMDFIENLMAPKNDNIRTVGLQCLRDKRKKVNGDMNARTNQIQALINDQEEKIEFIKQQAKKTLDDIKVLHDHLYGQDSKDVSTNTTPFMNYFTPNCRDTLSTQLIDVKSKGLIKVYEETSPLNERAIKAFQNGPLQAKELETKVAKLQQQIKKYGINYLIENKDSPLVDSQPGSTNFISATTAVQVPLRNFQRKKEKVEKYILENLEYKLGDLDGDFNERLADFTNNAELYFEKRLVNRCVTGSEDSSLGLNADEILRSLRFSGIRRTNLQALKGYKEELRNILTKNDVFIEDKLKQIEKMDKEYGVGTVQIKYKDFSANTTTSTPFEYFRYVIKQCRENLEVNNEFTAKDGKRRKSYQYIVDKSVRYLNELKSRELEFASIIGNTILSEVKHCGGRGMQAGACNENTMNPENPKFCITHSTQCGRKINGCHNEIQRNIDNVTNDIKAKADIYNKQIGDTILAQKNFLKTTQLSIIQDSELIKKFMPGNNYEFPESLFVKLSEMNKDKFGVNLRGGGELKILDSLSAELKKFKGMVKTQGAELDKRIGEYIDSQKASMEKNLGKWKGVHENCLNRLKEYKKAADRANMAMQQQHMQQQQLVADFCRKYNDITRTGSGGHPSQYCNSDGYSANKLSQEMIRVTSYIGPWNVPEVRERINEFNRHCLMFQNQGVYGTESMNGNQSSYKGIMSQLFTHCVQANNHFPKVRENLVNTIIGSLPPEWRQKESQVRNFLSEHGEKSVVEAFGKDLITTETASQLSSMKDLLFSSEKKTIHDYQYDLFSNYSSDLTLNDEFCTKLGLEKDGENSDHEKCTNSSGNKNDYLMKAIKNDNISTEDIIASLGIDADTKDVLRRINSEYQDVLTGSNNDDINPCLGHNLDVLNKRVLPNCRRNPRSPGGDTTRSNCVRSQFLKERKYDPQNETDSSKLNRAIASISFNKSKNMGQMGEMRMGGACVSQHDMMMRRMQMHSKGRMQGGTPPWLLDFQRSNQLMR